MKWNDFFRSVNDGKIDRVYLFTGPEEYIKQEALKALRAKILIPGLEQLNDTTLENVNARQMIDAAETLPVMADKRLLVVRDWAPLSSGKSKNEEEETERFLAWLENPPETSIVVFYMRSEPDGRKKVTSSLKKKGCEVVFEPLNDAELIKWVDKYLLGFGKKMSAQAVNELSFMAGRDLTRISGELDKLIAYVEDRADIGVKDVRAIVSASLEYNIFEIMNRLLEKKLGEAQMLVNGLIQNGENAVYILAMLTRQFRQLTHMRLALDTGQTVQQVQEMLKLHPYAAKQTARQCSGLNARMLEALYESCVETEYAIKNGQLRDRLALDSLLIKICSTKFTNH